MGGSINCFGEQRQGFLEGGVGLPKIPLTFMDSRDFHQCGGNAVRLFLLPEFRQRKLVIRECLREVLLVVVDLTDLK